MKASYTQLNIQYEFRVMLEQLNHVTKKNSSIKKKTTQPISPLVSAPLKGHAFYSFLNSYINISALALNI